MSTTTVVQARLPAQIESRPKELSPLARLLSACSAEEGGEHLLPASTCAVRTLKRSRGTDVHLLLFDVDPFRDPLKSDRLVLKHRPDASQLSREALSYSSICPLIDGDTAMFPAVEAMCVFWISSLQRQCLSLRSDI
jgi:hypothetical protein